MYGQKRPFLREQLSDVNGPDDLLRPANPKARIWPRMPQLSGGDWAPTLNRSECAILELWII